MAYIFSQAGNALGIAEQEYAAAAEVRFSTFTSCIGLVARAEGELTGVHLVMLSNDGSVFDNAAADAAVNLLGNYQQVVVIGQAGMWDDNINAAYQHLLGNLNNPIIIDVNDGIYGGIVDNNVFQTYQNGNYVNV
jgi:hypothetical protein